MQAVLDNEHKRTNVKADTKSPKLDRKGQPLSRVALLVEKFTATSQLTQRQIADIAGFKNQNIITMIKQGESKLPLDRVAGMAKALDTDPYQLFVMALEQFYSPEVLAEMLRIIPPAPTPAEREVLEIIREAGKHGKSLTKERLDAIRELFG